MTSFHERIATVLDRSGALDVALRVRGASPVPTVAIVTFHRVDDPDPGEPFDPDVVDATASQFRDHVETLARMGTVIDLPTLLDGLDGKPLPKNPVMITFDDGYRSCHDVALPVLRAAGVPATFFIATGFPDGGRLYWWEQIAAALRLARRPRCELTYPVPITVDITIPGTRHALDDIVKETAGLDLERFLRQLRAGLEVMWSEADEAALARRLIMGWDDIRALVAAGMDIGSHTRWHRVLDTIDVDQRDDELIGSRRDLQRELGSQVRAFAYPVGRLPELSIRQAVAAAGYEVAFTNASGVNHLWPTWLRPTAAYALRRMDTDRDYSPAMFRTQIVWPSLTY